MHMSPAESRGHVTPILECPLGVRLAFGMIGNVQQDQLCLHTHGTNILNHLSRALSRLRLTGHNLNIEQLRQQQHRVLHKMQLALCGR